MEQRLYAIHQINHTSAHRTVGFTPIHIQSSFIEQNLKGLV